jgi:hypothetical protein
MEDVLTYKMPTGDEADTDDSFDLEMRGTNDSLFDPYDDDEEFDEDYED